MIRTLVTLTTFAALLAITATEPALARHDWDARGWAPPHARAATPRISYAGDCGPNPPPGYRHDLKNWNTGFSDRDFSCYVLNEN